MSKFIKIIAIISSLLLIIFIPLLFLIKYNVLGMCYFKNNDSSYTYIFINDDNYKKLSNKSKLKVIQRKNIYSINVEESWTYSKEINLWINSTKFSFEPVDNYQLQLILYKENIFEF